MRTLVLLLLLATGMPAVAEDAPVQLIRHPQQLTEWDQRNDYFLDMLRLALDKTRDDFGDYLLEPSNQPMPQGRAINLLASNQELDVLWSMTSRQREEKLLPVRIPLLKGLMGYRIFIIRAEDQVWFNNIRTLDQLRELRAGQGHDWPDTEILRANGFHVEAAPYAHLFDMLEAGRFDFFPRALNEPWQEMDTRDDDHLTVEKHLLLYYPTASYFFVNQNNTALAERLETGLERAIADGSFEQLFREHPVNAYALSHAGLSKRRMLTLVNPLLPLETPLQRKALWWQAQ